VSPRARRLRRAGSIRRAAIVLLLAAPAAAPAQEALRPADDGVPEEGRHIGRAVPDILLTDASGREVMLSALWRERPLLIAFVFSRCAGVCSPLLASLRAAQDAVDPRDTRQDLAEWAERLRVSERKDWTFALAAPAEVERLTRATGFWSRWDETRQQFDHPALLAAIDRGRIVRLLVGSTVAPVRLQEVVSELRGDFVATYPQPGRVLVRCFQYDAARGRFVLDWGFLLLLLPAGATVATTLLLFSRGRQVRGEDRGPEEA
jgi:protein SCO1/2